MELQNSAMDTIANIPLSRLKKPTYMFRPHTLKTAVQTFSKYIPNQLLYAVKTNPHANIIQALHAQGIRHFDVASLAEIDLVQRHTKDAKLYYMHPIKPRHAIQEAYFDCGIRHFSFDSLSELKKIIEETDKASDLHLHLRLAILNTQAKIDLSNKFGLDLHNAPDLLKIARRHCQGLGVSFHVGSQCMQPLAYYNAILSVKEMLDSNQDIQIDYFNIGGGFPSIYPNCQPPALCEYFDKINSAQAQLHHRYQLLAEPGRSLVAESMSLIVRVDARKGHTLYINDGTYGGLFDAGSLAFTFPCKRVSQNHHSQAEKKAFSFFGPTCDSLDFMPGPFYLPEDINEGDLIEIGQVGAYSQAMASSFNGFSHNEDFITVSDAPLLSLYNQDDIDLKSNNIIAA